MRTFDLDQFWPIQSPPSSGGETTSIAAIAKVLRDAEIGIERAMRTETNSSRSGDAIDLNLAKSNLDRALNVIIELRRGAKTFLATFDARAALWLTMGFIAGVIAWHAVGFWGFVSDTVLQGTGHAHAVAWTPPAPITTGSIASYTPQPGACLALTLDRTSTTTSAAPCASDTQPMRDAGRRQRENRLSSAETRLQDRNAWPATTELYDAYPQAQLSESEFDLTLSQSQ